MTLQARILLNVNETLSGPTQRAAAKLFPVPLIFNHGPVTQIHGFPKCKTEKCLFGVQWL